MLFLLLSDTLGLRLVFLRVTFQFVWLLIAGSFIYLNWAGFSTLCFDDEKRFLVCLGICQIVLLYMHVTIEEETSNEKSKEKISRKKGKHYEKKVQIRSPWKGKKKRKKKNSKNSKKEKRKNQKEGKERMKKVMNDEWGHKIFWNTRVMKCMFGGWVPVPIRPTHLDALPHVWGFCLRSKKTNLIFERAKSSGCRLTVAGWWWTLVPRIWYVFSMNLMIFKYCNSPPKNRSFCLFWSCLFVCYQWMVFHQLGKTLLNERLVGTSNLPALGLSKSYLGNKIEAFPSMCLPSFQLLYPDAYNKMVKY